LLLDLGPDAGEGIGPRSPGMVHVYLTGQPAEPAILACRLVVDAGLGGGPSFGPTLLIEAVQTLDVAVRDHAETSVLGRASVRLADAADREI
jgi:hypothetical protein